MIIKKLIEQFRKTGIIRAYRKKELKELFHWEKNQLGYYLQKALKNSLLTNHKRKYKINLENELVKRIWEYNFAEKEENSMEKIALITKLFEKKRKLEEKISKMEARKKQYREEKIEKKAFERWFVEEIYLILTESTEQKEEIEKLCKENIEKIIR